MVNKNFSMLNYCVMYILFGDAGQRIAQKGYPAHAIGHCVCRRNSYPLLLYYQIPQLYFVCNHLIVNLREIMVILVPRSVGPFWSVLPKITHWCQWQFGSTDQNLVQWTTKTTLNKYDPEVT